MAQEQHRGITIEVPEDNAMYCRYPLQMREQGAYIELDPGERRMTADYNSEIGNGVPVSVWHSRIHRYHVPYALTDAGALQLMRDIAPLAARVCDGHEDVWDGNNLVGRLDDDARDADETITNKLDTLDLTDYPTMDVRQADEWMDDITIRHLASDNDEPPYNGQYVDIQEVGRITADTTDDQLAEMEETINRLADDEQIILDAPDAADYLDRLRKECRNEQ